MTLDRAELAGTGAALAFHVALIAALSMSLAHVASVPEPPSMEVEFVDEVGLTAAAPNQVAMPPPASTAPEIGDAEPLDPAPAVAPPAPREVTIPSPRPTAKPTPAKPAPARPAPRVSRIGDDFLKGIANSPSNSSAPAKPAAATFSATARTNVGQQLLKQAERCADREPYVGEGANKLRLTVNLKFNRSGRLARPPSILGVSGDPELRAKYGDLLDDQVRRIFADCAPFRLPAELYDTPTGGWNDFTFVYKVN